MSDARTEAIHKLGAELIQELVNAGKKNGGEGWVGIAIRKMEQVPDRCPPKLDTASPMLRVGNYLLSKLGEKVMVTRVIRVAGIQAGGDGYREVDSWDLKDIAKLKLWLNRQ